MQFSSHVGKAEQHAQVKVQTAEAADCLEGWLVYPTPIFAPEDACDSMCLFLAELRLHSECAKVRTQRDSLSAEVPHLKASLQQQESLLKEQEHEAQGEERGQGKKVAEENHDVEI
eukprot:Skav215857  [mRNA]  locus=scaffold1507:45936:50984:+ [translate_table: standard]